MIKTTEWAYYYEEGGRRERIRARYGMDYDFARRYQQAPYFSLVCDIEERYAMRWNDVGGGASHELIVKHFPELEPLVKWHCATPEGPLHYIANAMFWWEHAEAIRTFNAPYEWQKYGSPREAALAHFKSTVVFGALLSDEMPREGTPSPRVRDWLEVRLPLLCEKFKEAMRNAGVLE